jgi:ABC-type nitrate/sulfonate/bicarbonate transport system permease component
VWYGDAVHDARRAGLFGFVFQESVLFPWLTALANVELPLKVGRPERPRDPRELLELVGLREFAGLLSQQLSGGMPFALAVRSIPVVALTPLLIFLLGVDWKPKVAVAALVVFFPTLVNMAIGLRAVDARAFELMHVLNASRGQVLFRPRFPSSVPYFFAALKVAVPSAVLGAAVAEWINAGAGIGYLVIIATFPFQTPLLYATMVVVCATTMVLYWSVGLLERWLVPWREER